MSSPSTASDEHRRLSMLFHQVAQLVRLSTEDVSTSLTTNEDKLRLYGLYKHVTQGPCRESEDAIPSVFQVVARSKYQAWLACQDYAPDQAMKEYISIVSNRVDDLGQQCRKLQNKSDKDEMASANIHSHPSEVNKTDPQWQRQQLHVASDPPTSSNNAWQWLACWWSSLCISICQWLGIRPVVPRGCLDISYLDLLFALCQCCKWGSNTNYECQIISRQICQLWKEQTDQDVVVGLSARSLFDLYLTSKHFAPGSQVIVVPPISVPGMLHVLKHHELEIVPIDMVKSSNEWCHYDGVKAAITKKTVAIMVVHPFGMLATSPEQVEALRKLAEDNHLEFWEDCAQCFMGFGTDCYLGNPLADIRLYSFGLIKTVTALGGGIVSFRDAHCQMAVERLQRNLSQRQSTLQFLRKTVLAIFLNFIADSPWRTGLLATISVFFGLDFDTVITKFLRGFRLQNFEDAKSEARARAHLVSQIRKGPSRALLSLLLRRFHQSKGLIPSVKSRMLQCNQMKKLLSSAVPGIILPYGPERLHTYWAFPIHCSNRKVASQVLYNMGFDVTAGASQLCCVASFTDDPMACPCAAALMDSILYVPVASQQLSTSNLERLADAILSTTSTNARDLTERSKRKPTIQLSSSQTILYTCVGGLSACIVVLHPFLGFASSIKAVVWICASMTCGITTILLMVVLLLYFLRRNTAELYLKQSTALAEHSDMVDAATSSQMYSQALCSVACEGIISQMKVLQLPVNGSCKDEPGKRSVVITGATGFVGSLVLRDLLLHRKALSVKKVIVLCRPKKEVSANARISKLLNKPMFSFLSENEKADLVQVLCGDVTKKSAGLSTAALSQIMSDSTITHVFHCAAVVGFTQELPDAARANITSSIDMQALTQKLPDSRAKFVYISTAFVHGGMSGSRDCPLSEELFPLGPFSALEIYKSMLGTQYYASKAMSELQFPNSYTLSKCVCEHLLLQINSSNTIIIRPSIVGPAVEAPFEGWAGDRPSTIVAGACLHLLNQWNLWYLVNNAVSYIPVDVLSRFILAKAFMERSGSSDCASSSDGSFECVGRRLSNSSSEADDTSSHISRESSPQPGGIIFNATWDETSAEYTSFTWLEFSLGYLQLGCVLGYFDRSLAYLTMLVSAQLMPQVGSDGNIYRHLHSFGVRGPLTCLIKVMEALSLSTKHLRRVLQFLDLPLLFFPFVKRTFHFRSELVAPSVFDSRRYVLSVAVAAHRFISEKSNAGISSVTKPKQNLSAFVIGGKDHKPLSLDIWWVMSQPMGSILIRFCAWVFIKILRRVCTAVTVDIVSFRTILSTVKQAEGKGWAYLVLAPTHRSFFDFVLMSYLMFAFPELQLDLPYVVAASDFEKLPFIGWCATMLRAFYIERGRGYEDPSLKSRLSELKSDKLSSNGTCLELFLEGTRSRDRRFVQPKTGCLKSLAQTGGNHVVVPITINYEKIPEQRALSEEAAGWNGQNMKTGSLFGWLFDVFKGRVNVGMIHVAASKPVLMTNQSGMDHRVLANEIQRGQKEQVYISEYHVKAASKLLQVPPTNIQQGLKALECKFMPYTADIPSNLEIPNSRSELATVVLQIGHSLAPLFQSSHPKWSTWLDHTMDFEVVQPDIAPESVNLIRNALAIQFDTASAVVDKAIARLQNQGFSNPPITHILQTSQLIDGDIPRIFLHAWAQIRIADIHENDEYDNVVISEMLSSVDEACAYFPETQERLGFWGFADSYFSVELQQSEPIVKMKGVRYSLGGRSMARLLPFIENEMKIKLDLSQEFPTTSPVWFDPVPSDLSPTESDQLQKSFTRISFETVERIRHCTGHSQEDIFAIRSGESLRIPDAVVWPSSEPEVEKLVRAAAENGWCLIPFGGGTNVSNATRCPEKGIEPRPIISVDMKLMSSLLWVNELDGVAHVQAGITGRALVEELERRGFTMGHEPDSIEFSTLGGWIATKSSGMKRSRYGNIEDIVKSIRVVSSRGLLWNGCDGHEHAPGRVAEGLDLRSLIIGSEGCLGIVTSAVIRIWPLPEIRKHDGIVFRCFEDGLSFVRAVARTENRSPASVRLLDNSHFRLGQALNSNDWSIFNTVKKMAVKAAFSAIYGTIDEHSMVCATIGYEGSRTEVAQQESLINTLARQNGGIRLGKSVGKSGYDLTFAIAYLRDFAITYHVLGESFETFVPWSKIENVIRATKDRILREHGERLLPGVPFIGCRVTQLYHEGACLYFYLCINFVGVRNASEQFSELEQAARDEILKQGGSLSHHHGIGKHRAPHLKGRASLAFEETVKNVKSSLDDGNVFGARNGQFANLNK